MLGLRIKNLVYHAAGRIVTLTAVMSLIIGASSCEKRPDKVLSDSEMEDLMTDLMIAEAYEQSSASDAMPDSIRRSIGDAVLKSHDVDRETLDSTFAWYARNLDDYYRLYAKVERRLAKLSKEAGNNIDPDKNRNDIWPLTKHLQFSPFADGNALVFKLPGNSVAPGEKLEWHLHLNSESKADIELGIDYDNGTTSIARREFNGTRSISLSVIADTALTPKRIFGVVRLNRRDMPVWADSIYLSKMPFDSITYSAYPMQRRLTPPAPRIKRNLPGEVAEPKDSLNSSEPSSKQGKPRFVMQEQLEPIGSGKNR